jgi:hypothetical protein
MQDRPLGVYLLPVSYIFNGTGGPPGPVPAAAAVHIFKTSLLFRSGRAPPAA